MKVFVLCTVCLLSTYIASLQARKSGKETCYYVVKTKSTRLDCSRAAIIQRRVIIQGNPFTTPSKPPTTQGCKTVIEEKFFRVLIHKKAMDPVLAHFKSPNFPKLEPNKTIKCEWNVKGLRGKKYWINVLKQGPTFNSSDTTNCLWIKSKGSMCAGKVTPVLTKSNRLLMKMTLKSGQTDGIQGGLHGFYIEFDPTAIGRMVYPPSAIKEYPCKNATYCYEACYSTDSGPDLQLKPVTLTPAQNQSSTKNENTNLFKKLPLSTMAPTSIQPTTKSVKTDIPEYRKNSKFIEDLFKKFPLGRRKRLALAATGSIQDPKTTPYVEPYVEDDDCYMDPPAPAVNVSINESIDKRYFFNTNKGECQMTWVAKSTIRSRVTRNLFQTVTKCQKRCINICLLPMHKGHENGSRTKFYFIDGSCRPFQYTGKGGNTNRFDTKRKCELQCQAPTPGQFLVEAVKRILNNEASADDYKNDRRMICFLPHLKKLSTSNLTLTTTQRTPTTHWMK